MIRTRLLVALATGMIATHGAAQAPAAATSKHLAPGFSVLPKGTTVAIMPTDIELFEISGGGVVEPKADWTEAASKYFKTALIQKKQALGLNSVELNERQADELAEVNALHGAIARSIGLHHFGPLSLPTKEGKLDWSLGETVQAVRKATGADYALFSWVRDSYASAERKAMMVALAFLGVGVGGGIQTGYASLVDLRSGRIVWFNSVLRGTGDLREPDKAAETLNTLLDHFPISQ